MRGLVPTGETLDLGTLPLYWRHVDELFEQLQALPDLTGSRLLSARAFDEAQPAGPRTYMEVQRFLSVAQDNHYALLALLTSHGATVWAPWSLLRPVFETAFLAAWILDPDDGRTRRIRGLRCEVRDAYEQRKHLNTFAELPEVTEQMAVLRARTDAGAFATYRREAAELSVGWDTLQKVDMTRELPRLTAAKNADVGVFLVERGGCSRATSTVWGTPLFAVHRLSGSPRSLVVWT